MQIKIGQVWQEKKLSKAKQPKHFLLISKIVSMSNISGIEKDHQGKELRKLFFDKAKLLTQYELFRDIETDPNPGDQRILTQEKEDFKQWKKDVNKLTEAVIMKIQLEGKKEQIEEEIKKTSDPIQKLALVKEFEDFKDLKLKEFLNEAKNPK